VTRRLTRVKGVLSAFVWQDIERGDMRASGSGDWALKIFVVLLGLYASNSNAAADPDPTPVEEVIVREFCGPPMPFDDESCPSQERWRQDCKKTVKVARKQGQEDTAKDGKQEVQKDGKRNGNEDNGKDDAKDVETRVIEYSKEGGCI
jgi:hypothetical protein